MSSDIIKQFPKVAKALGRKGLASLAEHSREITVPEKVRLVRLGAQQSALYLLIEGCCQVSIEDAESFTDLGQLKPGDWIGKQSFFDCDHVGSADVTTTCESRLVEIRLDDFEALKWANLQAASALVRMLIAAMAARIRATNELVEAAMPPPSAPDEPVVNPTLTFKHRLLSKAMLTLSGSESDQEAP